MKKISIVFCLLIGLWHSSGMALGLGAIELQSRLGEPLLANMPLLSTGDLNIDEIIVRVASPDAHKKLDIDYQQTNNKLRFTVKRNDKKQFVLWISSHKVIKEPLVHFVLEVSHPDGILLKDITLLLDAPQ
jgi:pilus assembly protein FimV